MNSKIENGLRITSAVALFLVCGGCYAILELTLMPSRWPAVAVAVLLAALLFKPLRGAARWLAASPSLPLNIAAHLFIFTPLCLMALVGSNFWMSDSMRQHTEKAKIISRAVHTRKSGSGRRHHSHHTTKSYRIKVNLDDGREIELSTTREFYNRAQRRSSLSLTIEPGLLGYDVVKSYSL